MKDVGCTLCKDCELLEDENFGYCPKCGRKLNCEERAESVPWPKVGDIYYSVNFNGRVIRHRWINGNSHQFYLYNAGNCFRTVKEVTLAVKERVLWDMKRKYYNDLNNTDNLTLKSGEIK